MNVRAAWKPPFWLLALDIAGTALLALGLHARFGPDTTPVATALVPVQLPLILLGGLMIAAGAVLAVASLLAHRRAG